MVSAIVLQRIYKNYTLCRILSNAILKINRIQDTQYHYLITINTIITLIFI